MIKKANLFSCSTKSAGENKKDIPLADRVRPQKLTEFIGQEHLLGKDGILNKLIEQDQLPSLLFWGPPGCGKTTLARLLANKTKAIFVQFSAVNGGVAEIKKIIQQARETQQAYSRKTILFVDEIHHLNKLQQNIFLPVVEDGTIVLIGATTENPSFGIIAPLLSRMRILILHPLSPDNIKRILQSALQNQIKGLGKEKVSLDSASFDFLVQMANGDARTALNTLEIATHLTNPNQQSVKQINLKIITQALQHRALSYDRGGDQHYHVISAFIKSMRGSDIDASLYWLARLLDSGEDARFIARRMVIFASEDIGLADPTALLLAVAVAQAVQLVGLPEARINLAQLVVHLAKSPKDNSAYLGLLRAQETVKATLNLPVPIHLRNAVTPLMKKMGYGRDYLYPHDFSGNKVKQEYLPKQLVGKHFYQVKKIINK